MALRYFGPKLNFLEKWIFDLDGLETSSSNEKTSAENTANSRVLHLYYPIITGITPLSK